MTESPLVAMLDFSAQLRREIDRTEFIVDNGLSQYAAVLEVQRRCHELVQAELRAFELARSVKSDAAA